MLAELPVHSVRDRVLLLRSMAALAPLDHSVLVLLAEHARLRTFEPGELLAEEGKPIELAHLVVEGNVYVTRRGKRVARVTRGYGVGFVALLAGDEGGVRAEAEDRVQTLEVPSDALLNAFEENFALIRNGLRLQATALLERRSNLPADPRNPPPVDIGTYRERGLTLVERIIANRQSPIFGRANIDAVGELTRSNVEVRYEPGTVIWRIGDPATFFLRTDYGRIRCTNSDGEHVDIGTSFVLGALNCFSTRPHAFEARAETLVVAQRTSFETFLAVLEAHPDLAMSLLGVLARSQLPAD